MQGFERGPFSEDAVLANVGSADAVSGGAISGGAALASNASTTTISGSAVPAAAVSRGAASEDAISESAVAAVATSAGDVSIDAVSANTASAGAALGGGVSVARSDEVERLLAQRPTLAAWLAEYDAIGQEYVDGLAGFGIDFAPRNQDTAARQAVLQRLREKGARFRNGGASISCGPLSSACVACADDNGSRTFYLSLSCNRDCYFCFNKNQVNYEADKLLKKNWRAEVDEFLDGDVPVTHVALTGGEPLLHPTEALAFFAHVKAKAPQAHLRLYSDGDFLDESLAAQLAQAGLQELRLSVKPDEPGAFDEAVRRLAMAKRHIPEVMVEMPVAPEMKEEMKGLLRGMDAIGAFGVNLLEFGYPMGDWAPFAQRGYRIANPPFAIPYEYTYAGGLPVAGSELVCLELLEWAMDEGLALGVHYCSLENKNRMQMHQQNTQARLDGALWQFDTEDFFWKTAKVFDGDVPVAQRLLKAAGAACQKDADEESLQFHPRHLSLLAGAGVLSAISFNALERYDSGLGVRELALHLA